MNCKPGDLAFIVRSAFPENIGRIVRVLRPLRTSTTDWVVRAEGGPLKTDFGPHLECGGLDSGLRPIRPEPELLPAPPVAVTA